MFYFVTARGFDCTPPFLFLSSVLTAILAHSHLSFWFKCISFHIHFKQRPSFILNCGHLSFRLRPYFILDRSHLLLWPAAIFHFGPRPFFHFGPRPFYPAAILYFSPRLSFIPARGHLVISFLLSPYQLKTSNWDLSPRIN